MTTKLRPHTVKSRKAARYLGISDSALRQSRANGYRENRIPPPPFVRVGRTILYVLADLDNWLAEHRVENLEQGLIPGRKS